MTAHPKTLQEYQQLHVQLDRRFRMLFNNIDALAQQCDQFRAQAELATKSLKRTSFLTNAYWLILTALLGGLVGGSLAALIPVLAVL
jgi:hypothetical protein